MNRCLFSFLAFCVFLNSAVVTAEAKKPTVTVEAAIPQKLSDRLLYPATLAAFRIVPVHTDAEGLVSTLRVELGQSVTAGQTLALVTNPDPVSGFKPYALTAPISGLVTTLDIAVGDRVTKERVVLVIADLRSYKVKIHLTAADLLSLKPKDMGKLKLQGRELKVRIRVMSPMIDPMTGTAACELEIVADAAELKTLVPGSMGQVIFESNQRDGYLVTEDALVYKGKETFVIRVTADKKAEYVPIKILKRAVGMLEISGKINKGDHIVVASTGFIAEGEALETELAKTPSKAEGT